MAQSGQTNKYHGTVFSSIATIGNLYVTNESVGSLAAFNLNSVNVTSVNLVTNWVTAANLFVTNNISGGNLSLSGNLNVAGTITSINVTTSNVIDTNATLGSLHANTFTTPAATIGNLFANGSFIGIGTSTPSVPLHINSSNAYNLGSYYFLNSTGTGTSSTTNAQYSILVSGRIAAVEFNAYSDARLKSQFESLVGAESLVKIRQLKPTKFSYIDTARHTTTPALGFIAQEVQDVIDHSTTIVSDWIPNIYTHCKVVPISSMHAGNGYLYHLVAAGNFDSKLSLAVGDKLKVYNIDNQEIICTISEILADDPETTKKPFSGIKLVIESAKLLDDTIFVYGTNVSDLLVLKKDAIFTTGISAIQELDYTLRNVMTIYEAKFAALEQKINLLSPPAKKMK